MDANNWRTSSGVWHPLECLLIEPIMATVFGNSRPKPEYLPRRGRASFCEQAKRRWWLLDRRGGVKTGFACARGGVKELLNGIKATLALSRRRWGMDISPFRARGGTAEDIMRKDSGRRPAAHGGGTLYREFRFRLAASRKYVLQILGRNRRLWSGLPTTARGCGKRHAVRSCTGGVESAHKLRGGHPSMSGPCIFSQEAARIYRAWKSSDTPSTTPWAGCCTMRACCANRTPGETVVRCPPGDDELCLSGYHERHSRPQSTPRWQGAGAGGDACGSGPPGPVRPGRHSFRRAPGPQHGTGGGPADLAGAWSQGLAGARGGGDAIRSSAALAVSRKAYSGLHLPRMLYVVAVGCAPANHGRILELPKFGLPVIPSERPVGTDGCGGVVILAVYENHRCAAREISRTRKRGTLRPI